MLFSKGVSWVWDAVLFYLSFQGSKGRMLRLCRIFALLSWKNLDLGRFLNA